MRLALCTSRVQVDRFDCDRERSERCTCHLVLYTVLDHGTRSNRLHGSSLHSSRLHGPPLPVENKWYDDCREQGGPKTD